MEIVTKERQIVGGTGPVVVRMLQGMAGEYFVLDPGDLYRTNEKQAKLWAAHDVAEIVKQEPQQGPEHATQGPAEGATTENVPQRETPAASPPERATTVPRRQRRGRG